MKNVLAFIGAIALLVMFMSLKAVDGKDSKEYPRHFTTEIPLKQKALIVVSSQESANQYLKHGWILQDVDITSCSYGRTDRNGTSRVYTKTIYTLVKY